MQRRPFGNTGVELSIVALGGIVVRDTTPAEARDRVAFAIDRGVNYFDVAPGYGNAQECLGPALKPHRDDTFLACKTHFRERAAAQRDIERSLRLLKTDHVDLYQLHAMTTQEDLDQVLAPGGALETLVAAREAGKVRYLGFSAHSQEVALSLMDQFHFDSVLFPINWVGYLQADFGPAVVEKATGKGMAVLALKATAHHRLPDGALRTHERCWYHPITDRDLASLALRFTLSQPITAAIPPGDPDLWKMAVELAGEFAPITEEETGELRSRARGHPPLFTLAAD